MKRIIAIIILIIAIGAIVTGCAQIETPEEKYYRISLEVEYTQSKESDALKKKIQMAFEEEGYRLQSFFVKPYILDGVHHIQVYALTEEKELKIFNIDCEYFGQLYGVLITGGDINYIIDGNYMIDVIKNSKYIINGDILKIQK